MQLGVWGALYAPLAPQQAQSHFSILGHFGSFSGKREFLQKLGPLSLGYLWSLNFMQNMRQIYWAYPEKKCCHNRRTDKSNRFGHSSHVFAQARIFPKNSTPPVLSTYGPSTSCKISQKLMRQSWKKCCSNRQVDKLGHFGSPSGKWEIFQKIWLRQFWVLVALKLPAKY